VGNGGVVRGLANFNRLTVYQAFCDTMPKYNMHRVPTHLEKSWKFVNLENWNFMLDLEFLV